MYALRHKYKFSLEDSPSCWTKTTKKPFYRRAKFLALETYTSLLKSSMAQLARAIKILKTFDLVKLLLGTFFKKIIQLKQKAISIKMFTAPLSLIAKMWKPNFQQGNGYKK